MQDRTSSSGCLRAFAYLLKNTHCTLRIQIYEVEFRQVTYVNPQHGRCCLEQTQPFLCVYWK